MRKTTFIAALFVCIKAFTLPVDVLDQKIVENPSQPMVLQKVFEKTKKNKNWKTSVKTGDHEKIMFMNVSTSTTPDNEIGRSNRSYDQVILIVNGSARVSLSGKISSVKSGDMVFIPKGTIYNIANKSRNSNLKLASVCLNVSDPKDIVYKNKVDERR